MSSIELKTCIAGCPIPDGGGYCLQTALPERPGITLRDLVYELLDEVIIPEVSVCVKHMQLILEMQQFKVSVKALNNAYDPKRRHSQPHGQSDYYLITDSDDVKKELDDVDKADVMVKTEPLDVDDDSIREVVAVEESLDVDVGCGSRQRTYNSINNYNPHSSDIFLCSAIMGNTFCSYNTTEWRAMKTHYETKHAELPLPQPQSPIAPRHHYRSHNPPSLNGSVLYACDVCGKTTVSSEVLRVHMNTHKERKEFKCPLCYASYATPYALNRHTKKKHHNINESKKKK